MRKAAGYALMGFGLFMAVGVLLNSGGGFGVAAMVIALILFGAAPVSAGAMLLRPRAEKALEIRAQQAWHSEILRLADRRGGALTIREVVAHADLDAASAERYLDELCNQGLAETRVTDNGEIVYRFAEGPSEEEKRTAKGVLDD